MKIIKKVLSLFASSLAVLIFSGFLSLQPIGESPALAHHTDASPCNDIFMVPTGRTSTESVPSPASQGRRADVPDSGTLNFDLPDHDYQACAETAQRERTFSGTTVSGNFITGWVWNTNLGNISFSCEGGNNFGTGNCGAIDYGVVISETGGPGEDSRRVSGFAWGDNIGWISMGCNGLNNMGFDCGSSNYGVSIADRDDLNKSECSVNGNLNRGDLYGYAWSDSVGWINFCGAHVDLPEEGLTATVSFPTLVATEIKYANGSDTHEIVVRVQENDGVLIDPAKYEVTITPDWTDAVRGDQLTLCPNATDVGCPADRFNATAKGTFSWEAGRGFVASVTSLAPTVSTDELRLDGLTVEAREIRGGGGGGPPVAVTQPLFSTTSFVFQPAVSVLRIYSPDSSTASSTGDSLFAQRNVSTEHIISADFRPGSGSSALTDGSTARIFTQVHDCSTAFNFVFDEQSNGVGVTDSSGMPVDTGNFGDDADRGNIDRPNRVCPLIPGPSLGDIDGEGAGTPVSEFLAGEGDAVHRFIYTTVQDATSAGSSIEVADALGIQTRVEYTVGAVTVRYFSKRLIDSSLLNQAADVKGNVRIDVQSLSGLLGGRSEKSIGGAAGTSKSEFFNRAMDNLGWNARAVAITSRTIGNGSSDLTAGVHFFKRDPSLADTEPCKIIFSDAGDIDWNTKTTIASRGCDIYINSNILPLATHPNAVLGIVALEDFDMPKTAPRKGGNVYICSRVTDIKNVHTVAENSILPYGANESGCGNLALRIYQSGPRAGLPNFIDADDAGVEVKPVRETLKNQLVLTGSNISLNTVGGAFKNPPEAGDGRRITAPELMDTARYYDYNFFRYAHTVENPNPNPIERSIRPKCWADNIRTSLQYPTSCTMNNPNPNNAANANPGSKGIMNIQFAPPPSDLPVFNYKGR